MCTSLNGVVLFFTSKVQGWSLIWWVPVQEPREELLQILNYLDSREVTRNSETFKPNHHISSCLRSTGSRSQNSKRENSICLTISSFQMEPLTTFPLKKKHFKNWFWKIKATNGEKHRTMNTCFTLHFYIKLHFISFHFYWILSFSSIFYVPIACDAFPICCLCFSE